MKKTHFSLAILVALVLPVGLAAQKPTLTIDVNHPTAKVSKMLYGLMTEEINYSYDGGIYGELVRDRAVGREWGSLSHWPMVARGNSEVHVSLDETTGPSTALPRSIKVNVVTASETAPAGVENDGWWGIPVRPNSTYSGVFYAKTDGDGVAVTVSLVNDQTGVDRGDGNRDGADGRVGHAFLQAQDRQCSRNQQQSSDADDCEAGNRVARPGFALSAHL